MKPKPLKFKGFTLIELMIVAAIIGLLAAIAIPKFSNLVIKAREAAIRGQIGSIRSAINIYYADNAGIYPAVDGFFELNSLVPRYIDAVPAITIPTNPGAHPANNLVTVGGPGPIWEWADVLGPTAWMLSDNGQFAVHCDHTDSKGSTWSLF